MTQIRIDIADLHSRENTVEGAVPLQKMFDVTVILLDSGFAQPALLPSPSAVRLTLPLKGGRRHGRLKMTQKSKPGHRKTQVPLPSERRVEWAATGALAALPVICQSLNLLHCYLMQVGVDAEFARHPEQILSVKHQRGVGIALLRA